MTGRVSEMDRAAFLEHFGGVYEHSPWIAEQVFDTGLGPLTDTPSGLSSAMREVVDQAGQEPQRLLLRAHPDLAGRLAVSGGLTAASSAEQAGAAGAAARSWAQEQFSPDAVAARQIERLEALVAQRG